MGWYGVEDFVVDKKGNIYCGVYVKFNDFLLGVIFRILFIGEVEEYLRIEGWIIGMEFD